MHLKGEQHLAKAPVTLGLVFPFLPSYFSVPPLILSHSFSSVRIQRCQDDVRTHIINDLFVHWLLLLMLIKAEKERVKEIGYYREAVGKESVSKIKQLRVYI